VQQVFEDRNHFVSALASSKFGRGLIQDLSDAAARKEATFHFELYRVLHMLLRTSIYPASEFGGDSDGHSLDLMIPGPRWGLELTYDGRRLLGHMDRFSQTGQYGQWRTSHNPNQAQ
jgi:hypothetical protein